MKIHTLQGYIQNIYLVEYADKLLLLDGASRVDVPMLCNFIRDELGRALADLKLIVVTHVHPDHAGGVGKLKKMSGCKVATFKTNDYWYGGTTSLVNFVIDLNLAHFVAHKSKKPFKFLLYNPFVRADIELEDGDTLPNFPDWQALHTDGHTDRDLTLYHQSSSVAYTADLIIKTRKGFISPFPIYYPQRYKQSIQKLMQLNPKSLLLAHGGQVSFSDVDTQKLLDSSPTEPLTNQVAIKTGINIGMKKIKKAVLSKLLSKLP